MNILGIDEAGRGCLVGNLIIAGAVVSEDWNDEFRKRGIKDSPKKRYKLRDIIIGRCFVLALPISIEEIDSGNLNDLEAKYTAKLMAELKNYDKVVVDCPSTSTVNYAKLLKQLTGQDVIAEHKADVNHVAVSCASIIAKTVRDNMLKDLQDKYKHFGDFGSGYTSDKKTIVFLKANIGGEADGIFRKSWSTYSKMKQQSLGI